MSSPRVDGSPCNVLFVELGTGTVVLRTSEENSEPHTVPACIALHPNGISIGTQATMRDKSTCTVVWPVQLLFEEGEEEVVENTFTVQGRTIQTRTTVMQLLVSLIQYSVIEYCSDRTFTHVYLAVPTMSPFICRIITRAVTLIACHPAIVRVFNVTSLCGLHRHLATTTKRSPILIVHMDTTAVSIATMTVGQHDAKAIAKSLQGTHLKGEKHVEAEFAALVLKATGKEYNGQPLSPSDPLMPHLITAYNTGVGLQTLLERCIQESGVGKNSITEVVFVSVSGAHPPVSILNAVAPKAMIIFGDSPFPQVLDIHQHQDRIVDVTPYSFGIVVGATTKKFSELIARNTQLPCQSYKEFTTTLANQTAVTLILREYVKCDGVPADTFLAKLDTTAKVDEDIFQRIGLYEYPPIPPAKAGTYNIDAGISFSSAFAPSVVAPPTATSAILPKRFMFYVSVAFNYSSELKSAQLATLNTERRESLMRLILAFSEVANTCGDMEEVDRAFIHTEVNTIIAQIYDSASAQLRAVEELTQKVVMLRELTVPIRTLLVQPEQRENMQYVCEHVRAAPFLLRYVADTLRFDPSFLIDAIKVNAAVFKYIPDNLAGDPGFVTWCVKANPNVVHHVPKHFFEDQSLLLDLCRFTYAPLAYASNRIRADKGFLKSAISRNVECVRAVSSDLLQDISFVISLLKETPSAFTCLPEYLQNNVLFVFEVLRATRLQGLDLPSSLLDDEVFMTEALIRFPYLLETVPWKNNVDKVTRTVRGVCQWDLRVLQYIDESVPMSVVKEGMESWSNANSSWEVHVEALFAACDALCKVQDVVQALIQLKDYDAKVESHNQQTWEKYEDVLMLTERAVQGNSSWKNEKEPLVLYVQAVRSWAGECLPLWSLDESLRRFEDVVKKLKATRYPHAMEYIRCVSPGSHSTTVVALQDGLIYMYPYLEVAFETETRWAQFRGRVAEFKKAKEMSSQIERAPQQILECRKQLTLKALDVQEKVAQVEKAKLRGLSEGEIQQLQQQRLELQADVRSTQKALNTLQRDVLWYVRNYESLPVRSEIASLLLPYDRCSLDSMFTEKVKLYEGRHKVYRAVDIETKRVVVVKEMDLVSFEKESNVLRRLKHPNVVEVLNAFVNENAQDGCIVFPLAANGSLAEYLGKSDTITLWDKEEVAKLMVRSILQGIAYVHSVGVVHNDIKPMNVLVHTDGTPWLCDFDVATLEERTMTNVITTTKYMAPEILVTRKPTTRSDMWSFGQLVEEVTANRPYRDTHPQWKDFIEQLKRDKPEDRLTAGQALQHALFGGLPQHTSREELLLSPPLHWNLADASVTTSSLNIKVPIGKQDPLFHSLQQVLMRSCIRQTLGSGRDQKVHITYNYLELDSAYRIENKSTWMPYALKRQQLRSSLAQLRGKVAGGIDIPWDQLSCATKDCPAAEVSSSSPSLFSLVDEGGLDASANEVYLWHGTRAEVADIIIQNGFDERVANLRGFFGAAIYFAENSSKSDQYCVDDPSGRYYIFLSRVLLGHPCKGDNTSNDSMGDGSSNKIDVRLNERIPPERPEELGGGRYDSIVGVPSLATSKYREFVVYDRTQCYPEYLLVYRRTNQ
eukprot:PhF_6_TR17085/c0_g1_i1/m.26228